MNNIESLNLDSLMGGGPLGGYPALLGTTVSGSSLGLANGSLSTSSTGGVGQGMLSSSSSGSDSLLSSTLDDFVSGHHLGQGTNGISGHSSSNSHLSNHNASTSVSHSHPELAAHLTTSTSGHYINSTASNSISTTSGIGTSSGGSVGSSSSFNLDQFDSIDATSCQLLQSYSIIKDDDYALLVDDEDLVGSLMLGSSGLTVPDHMGVVGGHSISEHLTAAQYNLLEDCLDHITSSESGLGGSMATSSTSIATSIATSSTLNQLNSTLNSSVLNTRYQLAFGSCLLETCLTKGLFLSFLATITITAVTTTTRATTLVHFTREVATITTTTSRRSIRRRITHFPAVATIHLESTRTTSIVTSSTTAISMMVSPLTTAAIWSAPMS